jgi:hypothetical protein
VCSSAAVCGSAKLQCDAAVSGSVCSSPAVCGSAKLQCVQCDAILRQRVQQYVAACAAVCGSAKLQCDAIVRQRVQQCGSMWQC